MSERTCLGIVIAVGLAVGLPTVFLPPFRDHAIFMLVASVIRDGHMPYLDAVDFKPPGLHLAYALGGLLSGRELWGPRLLDVLAHVAGAAALVRLAGRDHAVAGLAAGLLWTLTYFGAFGYAELGQAEGFLISAVLVARSAVAGTGSRARTWAFAGALMGGAVLFKYTAVFFLGLFAFAHPPRRAGAAFAAGLAGALLAAVLYLVAGGAIAAFLDIQTHYLPGYSALVRQSGAWAALSGSAPLVRAFFGSRPVLILLALAGLAALATGDRRRVAEPWVGLSAALVGVLLQGKFFFYHWIPAVPFLAWLGVSGYTVLTGRLGYRSRRKLAWGAGAFLALVTTIVTMAPRAAERSALFRFLTGRIDRGTYYGDDAFGRFGEGEAGTLAAWRLAEAIARHCPVGERVFVWGFEPLAYVASGRAPASRFIYNAPFVSPWCPEAWKQELVSTLIENPPRVIVLAAHDAIPWVTGVALDSRAALVQYPAILELLRTAYEPVEEVERFIILTRTS